MKKFVSAVLLLSALSLFNVPFAAAHVLKTDGQIGAVMHLEPDDDPAVGSPSSIELFFSDTTGRLNLKDCLCRLVVTGQGVTITHPLYATSTLEATSIITFPKAGTYNMAVTGQPKKAEAFQAFKLNYQAVALGNQTTTQPFPPLLWLALGLGICLVLLAAYVSQA